MGGGQFFNLSSVKNLCEERKGEKEKEKRKGERRQRKETTSRVNVHSVLVGRFSSCLHSGVCRRVRACVGVCACLLVPGTESVSCSVLTLYSLSAR